MGITEIIKRVLGISATPPAPEGSWRVEDSRAVLELAQAPALAAPGGAYRLEGQGLAARVVVMAAADGGWRAYVNRCTHAGRRLDAHAGGAGLMCCSVGRSTFDLAGGNTGGTAKKPITELATVERDGCLVVELG